MGLVQSSTSRAAKFSGSGNRRSLRNNNNQQVVRSSRRHRSYSTSCNVNRNAKEFSRFWTSGGQLVPKARGNSMSSSTKSSRGKEAVTWKKKSQISTEIPITRRSSHDSSEGKGIEGYGSRPKSCENGRLIFGNKNRKQTSSCDYTYGSQLGEGMKRSNVKKISSISLPHEELLTNVPVNICNRFDDLKL
uniref:Ovule protein n=1 Tax=Parastrongyloides trichosuri TaxID=131310 RepID=A0A0N4ZQX4_PARTI